ncbi:putative malate dehydrogenase 1B [Zophobas morio]|uniref:putative malate dehydrogenase 1B n=1 Tax=Zophobas morio TaxID=2755281 RepID=UPI003083B468
MAYYVIAGKLTCLNTTHALHIAETLSLRLPNFHYRRILKSDYDWPIWLDQLNSTNNWHETCCPLAWKEVGQMGGKPHLIGNLGHFWEYCFDYYGIQSWLSKTDLEKIKADDALMHTSGNKTSSEPQKISITDANTHPMLELVIYELQQLFSPSTLEIKLYDANIPDDEDTDVFMLETLESYQVSGKSSPQSIVLVSTLREALQNCDVLIVLGDYRRLPDEAADDWLNRCRLNMIILADEINSSASRSLKVILNHPGPICFNASVLMEYCTQIRLSNIVAVTTDEGLSVISTIAHQVDRPVEHFWCPAVWGFSGIMSFVGVACTPLTQVVIQPYKRSLKTKESSKLPKGEIVVEIKFVENLLKTEELFYEELEHRKERELDILQRPPVLAKVRALASLLKLWFAEVVTDEIISLGVCSNGAFRFPPGVCFSQPVSLNEKRIWEPVASLPLTSLTQRKVADIVLQVEGHLKNFGIGDRLR